MPSKFYLALAAVLAAAPSAALARDGLPYVGIEGGVTKPNKLKLDYRLGSLSVEDGVALEHKTGFDVDVVAGYDLGAFRVEGELGWKRASHEDVQISPAVFTTTGRPAVEGRTRVLSAMVNALVDLGSEDGLQVYAGGGVGGAKFAVDSRISGPGVPLGAGINGDDRSFAWQGIAGMRLPVSYNVDLGLKYRYFNSKMRFDDANSGLAAERLSGKYRSHSLLASLIFNIGSPPAPPPAPIEEIAPPPPPPAPPATQTCPDGSVILATDACPVPPPPPPPPPAAPERG